MRTARLHHPPICEDVMTHGIVNIERTHSVCSDLPAYKTRGHAPLSLPQTHIGRDKSRPYSGTDAAVGLWHCRSLLQRRTRETRRHASLSHVAAIISQPYSHNATNIVSIRRLGFPLSTVERGSGGEVKRVNGVRSNYSDFYSLNIYI